jgi:hypothetical protein
MVGSIREVLRWLLTAQLDCRKMAETGKSKGSYRLLALPSKNRNTPCGPPYYAMPGFPPSNALAVKKYLVVNTAPLVQRDPPLLQGPITVNPTLSSRNIPIRSRYPHFAIHHDRPISVLSLDRWRGREKLSRKERRSSYEEGGCITSDIALSARPRTSGRLADWHILQIFPVARRLSYQFCS